MTFRDLDSRPGQEPAPQVTSGTGVLAGGQRRSGQRAERQFRVHLVQRVPAGLAVLVGFEQLGPQAPRLDAEALAGQLAAAPVRGLVAGLRPDLPGRDGEHGAAPGTEQAAGGPVRLAPARLEQPERHIDPDHHGARNVSLRREQRGQASADCDRDGGPGLGRRYLE